MNRSKTPLVLMEQLVMLLVFALAAAVCLRIFVLADQTSRQVQDRDRAAQLCQNAAEALQANHGDVEGALTQVNGTAPGWRGGFGFFANYDEDWNVQVFDGQPRSASYTLRVLPLDSGVPGLGKAEITAYRWENGEMEPLFSLETAWQEVSGHGA